MKARVIPQNIALQGEEVCIICKTALTGNNTAYWSTERLMCRDCASTVRGKTINEYVAALLICGYIQICYYSKGKYYSIRVEIRSSNESALRAQAKQLRAGRVYPHSPGVFRWSAASKGDIRRLAQMLMPYTPPLATALLRYCAQDGRKRMSSFAEAIALKAGTRSLRLLEYVELD